MRRKYGRSESGFTLIELMIVIAIIAIIAAIAIPGLLSSQRASNERNASTSLKTLTSAEADFRSNDRDWNHAIDFWTGDVKGLYCMTSAAVSGNTNSTIDPIIKLIELSVASADADAVVVSAGGECAALSNFAIPSPKAGYWYQAWINRGSGLPDVDVNENPKAEFALHAFGKDYSFWWSRPWYGKRRVWAQYFGVLMMLAGTAIICLR